MISFTDEQMCSVMTAAESVRPELRDAFLKLIASQLKPSDVDINDAIERALRYLGNEQNRVA